MKNRWWIWGLVALFATVWVAGEAETREKLPRIDGKKVLMVVASQNFRDEELQEPKQLIEKQGGKVVIGSSSLKTARGMLGAKVTPDILLKDVKPLEYDAVVFVGGTGASEYWKDQLAHRIASQAARAGKVVGAICIAPVTLANAGLLRGKRATVWASEKSVIEGKGAAYTGADVEIDGRIVTANGPKSAEAFGAAIVRALAKEATTRHEH